MDLKEIKKTNVREAQNLQTIWEKDGLSIFRTSENSVMWLVPVNEEPNYTLSNCVTLHDYIEHKIKLEVKKAMKENL